MNDHDSEFDGPLAGDHADGPVPRSWQPHPWWAWHLAGLALGTAVLVGGGVALSHAQFGTSLRARACDLSPVGGLLLLVAGALLVTVAMQLARLQHPSAVVGLEWRGAAFALPVPLVLLAATLPGLLGCSLGRDIAAVGTIGDALVGAPGITLAGAAAALVGVALGSVVHVTWLAPVFGLIEEPPGIVELAMQEAEALESDAASQRFHGVD
ncbi:MAG: hypothetical protein JWL76_1944 [Thermoleophilia bacterium]|nr:hypothetical protein [Thermoleophilia bacterium]